MNVLVHHYSLRLAVYSGVLAISLALLGLPGRAQDFPGSAQLAPFDEDMIHYSRATDDTVVSRLQKRLDAGAATLSYDRQYGYLLSVLEALKIPRASQMLVFSKTSLQRSRIFPGNPRAIYFNDEVYIGWIPGAPMVEISAVDPKLGSVFYTIEQSESRKPKFVRNDQCLECHASAKTIGVPGDLVRSFVTGIDGDVNLFSGIQVNHRTPFAERWGGWYVTGAPPGMAHRGNLAGNAAFDRREKEPDYRASVADLSSICDTAKYPRPSSDIAALLVLEHQTHLHNFITRLNYESTLHLAQYGHVRYLKSISEAFLRYLLFIEEASFTSSGNERSDFAQWFESQGPEDKQGRSLRQLDLKTRTFKYPCSYLIYSDAFDKLPRPMKLHLYHRLWQILAGEDKSAEFEKIPTETKQAIREILIATKADLPVLWRLQ
ncbi:MAG: hypothetical protein EXS31_19195 [Pedosphaera sp.]|nr:hypothetical protein [Pedosphaera sp.]